eukprot:5918997-Alexandrium_andersonii.AAC.1
MRRTCGSSPAGAQAAQVRGAALGEMRARHEARRARGEDVGGPPKRRRGVASAASTHRKEEQIRFHERQCGHTATSREALGGANA